MKTGSACWVLKDLNCPTHLLSDDSGPEFAEKTRAVVGFQCSTGFKASSVALNTSEDDVLLPSPLRNLCLAASHRGIAR